MNGLLTTVGWQLGGETTYCLEGSVFIAGALVQWLRDGLRALPRVSPAVERLLLAATRVDRALLGRRDLPFGSSVVVAARKPSTPDGGRDRSP